MTPSVRSLLEQLLRDETGQDLVEYALLTAFFGVTLLAVWNGLTAAVGASYGATTAGVQSLWDPPPPGGSSP